MTMSETIEEPYFVLYESLIQILRRLIQIFRDEQKEKCLKCKQGLKCKRGHVYINNDIRNHGFFFEDFYKWLDITGEEQ